MSFYQELQLDQAGSKRLIASCDGPKEKARHICALIVKLILISAFSVAFITVFSAVFGAENGIVGLVALLCVQLFRVSDLGMRASHGVAGIFLIFGIYAVGPAVAAALPAFAAFAVNLACIFTILLVGCRHVQRSHQLILILGYLLLLGYPVEGEAFTVRLAALATGAALTAVVMYRNHRGKSRDIGIGHLFQEFNLNSERSRWQVRFTIGVSSAMLIASFLPLAKPIWMGIAAMSVFVPTREGFAHRVKFRALANIVGCAIFVAMYFMLPKEAHGYLGVIGGFAQGLSATYGWQTAFNTIGALSMAATAFGLPYAIFARVLHNIFGSLYAWLVEHVFDRIPALAAERAAQEPQPAV